MSDALQEPASCRPVLNSDVEPSIRHFEGRAVLGPSLAVIVDARRGEHGMAVTPMSSGWLCPKKKLVVSGSALDVTASSG